MSINLNIQADVIDINNDTPQQGDIFLVDTNVWLWLTYPNASHPNLDNRIRNNAINSTSIYTPYIGDARRVGATLTYSGLIMAELSHVIEKTERNIYNSNRSQPRRPQTSTKEYRHNLPQERARVVLEVESAWRQVESLAVPIDLAINEANTQAALTRFKTQALDGYDLLILEAISRAGTGVIKVITDDSDYAVVPGIQLFSANRDVIQQARQQRKLISRP